MASKLSIDARPGFWSALESLPGLCATTAEWKLLMGPEYDAATKFLRPDGSLATCYPCAAPQRCGCAHEVIQHGPDDIVAVCRCEPKRCDTITLSRRDIILYEVNRRAIGDAVATALGVDPEHATVPGLPLTWSIGIYSPYAGFRFPVYLTIQVEPEVFQRVAEALVARAERPFILVAPTRDMFGPDCEETLRRRKAHLFALTDDCVLGSDGTIGFQRPSGEILRHFLAAVLPATNDASPMAFFPTPSKATWSNVEMRFKDGHTVSVQVMGERGVFNYTQMGMANKKNGDPTKQWELLRAFADEHGVLDWSSKKADRRNQKRREILAANLRSFFRIEEDPIELTEDGKGWKTRFCLQPES